MNFFSQLNPLTKGLALVILLSCAATLYNSQRLEPRRAELERERREATELQERIRDLEHRVAELHTLGEDLARQVRYATLLDQQSPGRTLQGTLGRLREGRGGVQLVEGSFRPREGGGRGLHLRVRAGYEQHARLLTELDRAFPPVELQRLQLTLDPQEHRRGDVVMDLEGVLHGAR